MKIDKKNHSAFKENDSLKDKGLQELFLMEPMGFEPTTSSGAPPRMARRKRARRTSTGCPTIANARCFLTAEAWVTGI